MKVAYYYNGSPNKYATDFCIHVSDVEFMHNTCDKDVDFIYCGSPDAGGCLKNAFNAKMQYRKPLICFVWDIPHNLPELKHVAIQNTNLLRMCDGVISACKNTQQVLQNKFHIKSSQLYFYVPDLDIIQTIPDTPKINQIIQVGRYVPHKQHEMAINAIYNMKHINLVCIGMGIRNQDYFNSLNPDNIENVKIYTDVERTELLTEIKKSKLLISSSYYEGFGLPPIESLFLNTPVILYDMPVFREIYQDSVPYFSCESQLHEFLEDFFDNDTRIGYSSKMLEMQKKRVDTFTPEKFAKRWLDECTKLLQNFK